METTSGTDDGDAGTQAWTDSELTELALATSTDEELADDAQPWHLDGAPAGDALLPEWYMPVPQAGGRTPGRVFAVGMIIAALLIVNGAGLCVTYGLPEIAW